jgi:hypothetical protein
MSEAPSGAFSFFMLLCSETGDEVELRLLRYQFPQTLSGDDANWLITKHMRVSMEGNHLLLTLYLN